MKQPLYPSSRALRVIIAAVIMIIANATTARAQEIGGGGGIELSPESTPLTLEATVACDITVSNPRSGMKYSVDGGKTMVLMTGTTTIDVAAEKTVQFYGKGTEIKAYYGTNINCSAYCYIYGNIMSLVDETGFGNNRELTASYTFLGLFEENTHLINHPEKPLVLPATTLTECCYESMFDGCTSLTTAPDLPATTLATGCYSYMFTNCTSLTDAPSLPATTLAEFCYDGMFRGCTGLNTAPDLPAKTLATNCYKAMFSGCTKLSYVRCLATDISAEKCTDNWLQNVAPSGTFVKAVNAAWSTGISGIPSGWNVEEDIMGTPLTLQATADGTITVINPRSGMQYSVDGGQTMISMSETTTIAVTAGQTVQFYGNGTKIKAYYALDTDWTHIQCSSDCYIYGNIMSLVDEKGFAINTELRAENTFRELFYNNTHLISHPTYSLALPAKTLTLGCYNSMFRGCTSLTAAPDLPAKKMKESCYGGMFYGCTSLTTAPSLPAEKLAVSCYSGMFRGCTGLTSAPDLPATTLKEKCYYKMFYGCTKLNYVVCLATDISASDCTDGWLDNVAASGTFIKAANTKWSRNSDGIPNGWTVRVTGGLTLYDNGRNSSTVEENDEQGVSYVVLAGRTLYRDGTWNTLCLPFRVSDGDANDGITFTGTPLAGATVKTLTAASSSNGILTLTFGPDVTTIEAGKPYAVKWTTTGSNIQSPVFDNVTIKNVTNNVTVNGVVTFNGIYDPTTYDAEDRSTLLLDADRSQQAGSTPTLQYATSGTRLGACRAYFDVVHDGLTGITDCVLDFGNNETQTCPFVDRGDANGDGTISVTDIAVVVNCILRLPNTGGYSPGGADANGDNDITVTDIGVIVDKILGTKPHP